MCVTAFFEGKQGISALLKKLKSIVMTRVFTDWTEQMSADFGQEPVLAGHGLHEREMFSDKGLADLLDRYPREHLGIYTMDDDLGDHTNGFRRGFVGDLSGEEILSAINRGRLWLNLRAVNEHLTEYDALCNEMFDEIDERVPGLHTFKRDCGVLISSPKARVFYHLDIPCVSLWQIRGTKTIHVYPTGEPYASDEQIEAIVLGETEEEIDYNPSYEAGSRSFELSPGKMVSWPQLAPHRVDNGDCVNISLSCEFLTMKALILANSIYANAILRRKFGGNPSMAKDGRVARWSKAALARAFKLAQKKPELEEIAPVTFKVDLQEETGIRDLRAA